MARTASTRTKKAAERRKDAAGATLEIPLLPIRDNVHFPRMIFPLFVGREKSVRALDEAMAGSQQILLAAQREVGTEDPEPSEVYSVGIIAEIMQILKVPDGTVRVMLEGLERVRIVEYIQNDPYFLVRVEKLPILETKDLQAEAIMRSVVSQFEQIVNIGKNIPPEALISLMSIDEPGRLADHIAWHMPSLRVETKQELLELLNPQERLEKLSILLKKEFEILEIQKNIRSRVEKEMGDTQREFILREQLKAIQQELGERDERQTEVDEFRVKVQECGMPEEVATRAVKEIDRLEKMPYAAPEGVVIRTYLETLVALPWAKASDETLNIDDAVDILDEDHYGLPKVKERILEFLAVRKLTGTLKGPILCFVGPPGVGKTSLGKSIARALGRKFIRISLGGVRDEAEIRGHRRTYIGAMPGRIIQGLKQTEVNNPVFMLDEIDKMGSDFRGDPSSALLEALDPEQNVDFSDHYLEVPFNLSDVMFITTANLLDPIPPALRDRMEIISFSGYIEDEKVQIARKFLIPKQIKDNGLQPDQLTIPDAMILKIIREHTREAGLRGFEREIATVCRKVARAVATGRTEPVVVGPEEIRAYLGQRKYHYGVMEEEDEIGAATGLVYTEAGGDVISIEITLMRGKDGRLTLTGQLGDVMKESAQAALSYVRSRARALDIEEDFYERLEIHVHVPAGAIPKDGPSAGITMATALASALTKRAVRKDVAMTGEITLRGRVLPIGGLKEKVLAAHRAGIRTVILPFENEKDLEDLPNDVREEMKFEIVKHVDEVLELALLPRA
ncbi:MAG: endopeptidase La [Capsulimonas sp.]|uniref:endopeptidase La n=1 Tax=Capsulimonas sp. TaxID=2494211 RepID=UPI003262DF4C